MKKKYSVVIPALNEERHIASAVAALTAQTLPRIYYEIIVVDNGSTDQTAAIATKAGADIVVREPHRGTNFARQRGVEESSADIIAFLDADCVPPSDWLAKIAKRLADPEVKAISGPCDFGFGGLPRIGDRLYVRKLFPNLDRLLFLVFRKRAGVILGGNFAVRRSTLEAIGGFPPFTFHGDDSAVAMLISRKVGRVVFDRDMSVASSPRRFEREGHLTLTLTYAWYYLKNYFFLREVVR